MSKMKLLRFFISALFIFMGAVVAVAGLYVVFGLTAVQASPAADGDLDSNFSDDGRVTEDFIANTKDAIYDIALQADGKIVAVGVTRADGRSDQDFALVRYLADGTPDPSFSGDGYVRTDFDRITANSDTAKGVVIQSNGNIVVAGEVWSGSDYDIGVARYDSSGQLDPLFGNDGLVIFDSGVVDSVTDVALQSDGSIIVVGYVNNSPNRADLLVVRFTSSVLLDTTFGGGDGYVTTDVEDFDHAYSVAIQNNDRIVVSGMMSAFGGDSDFLVVRYTAAGTLDTTFSGDGLWALDLGGNELANDVQIQSNGRIIGVGSSSASGYSHLAIFRLTGSGGLDSTFSGDGVTVTDSGTQSFIGTSAIIQGDGHVMVGGYAYVGTGAKRFALARYLTTGVLDNSFSSDGLLVSTFATEYGFGDGLQVQSDGKVVLAGRGGFYTTDEELFTIARYSSSGVLDTAYGDGGVNLSNMPNSEDVGYAVNRLPDGRTMVVGQTDAINSSIGSAVYLDDGSLDTNYSEDGLAILSDVAHLYPRAAVRNPLVNTHTWIAGYMEDSSTGPDFMLAQLNDTGVGSWSSTDLGGDDRANDLAVNSAGELFVGGSTNVNGDTDLALVKYDDSGSVLLSFGIGGSAITDLGGYEQINGVVVQDNGRVVVIGNTFLDLNFDVFVARYYSWGDLDTNFSGDGWVVSDIGGADAVTAVAIDSSGNLYVGGNTNANGGYDFALLKYTPAGYLEPSFGTGGKVITDIGGGIDAITDMVIQTDGRILVAGYAYVDGDYDFALARYDTDGTLDTNFGTGGIITTDFGGNDRAYNIMLKENYLAVVTGSTDMEGHQDFATAQYIIGAVPPATSTPTATTTSTSPTATPTATSTATVMATPTTLPTTTALPT
ncbi:MAG: hypothetical protein KDE51_17670, partial [Anaerolineales bacterium]|nr:hypothetical protein [Anaerolineales bacterium]